MEIKKYKVLIVDDEIRIARLIQKVLIFWLQI